MRDPNSSELRCYGAALPKEQSQLRANPCDSKVGLATPPSPPPRAVQGPGQLTWPEAPGAAGASAGAVRRSAAAERPWAGSASRRPPLRLPGNSARADGCKRGRAGSSGSIGTWAPLRSAGRWALSHLQGLLSVPFLAPLRALNVRCPGFRAGGGHLVT